MELRICQSLFDRQSEMTRQAADGISSTHVRIWMSCWWFRRACVPAHTNYTLLTQNTAEIGINYTVLRNALCCAFSRRTTCEAWQSLWRLRPVSSTSATNTPRSCRNSWPGLNPLHQLPSEDPNSLQLVWLDAFPLVSLDLGSFHSTSGTKSVLLFHDQKLHTFLVGQGDIRFL